MQPAQQILILYDNGTRRSLLHMVLNRNIRIGCFGNSPVLCDGGAELEDHLEKVYLDVL